LSDGQSGAFLLLFFRRINQISHQRLPLFRPFLVAISSNITLLASAAHHPPQSTTSIYNNETFRSKLIKIGPNNSNAVVNQLEALH
jgi:hypothetical protein